MTGPEAQPALPVARPPRGNIIPIPSDRASLVAHVVGLTILLVETAYWLAQPCIGDIVCAPMIGFATGITIIPLALGIAIWRLARRSSLLVVVDAVLVTFLVPLSVSGLSSGSLDPVGLLLLPGLPLALVIGVLEPIADLGSHRLERWIVVVTMAFLAIGMTFLWGMVAPFPALIAFVLAFDPPIRGPRDGPPPSDAVLHSPPHGRDREE
jgi:hypothetical protein